MVAVLVAAQEPLIRVDVEMVNLLCSVRNKKGAFIKDLTKEQFHVYEDGKKQEIRYFARETELPLTIGLLVDVSKSQENLIEVEKRAAAQFFEKMLREKDMAFLISFGAEAELLQDFTGSPRLLKQGLEDLRLSVPVGGLHPSPVPGTKMRGTILYDAVYLAVTEKLRGEVGRKVVVVITDGVDTGSRLSAPEVSGIAAAIDVPVYLLVVVTPLDHPGDRLSVVADGAAASTATLADLARWTGGDLRIASAPAHTVRAARDLLGELRYQYLITFEPDPRPGWHPLDVRTRNRDLIVHARGGYLSGPVRTAN